MKRRDFIKSSTIAGVSGFFREGMLLDGKDGEGIRTGIYRTSIHS